MRQKLQRFMMGRYGGDQLGQIYTGASLVLLIVSMFTGWNLLYLAGLGLMIYETYRMMSRNIEKRYAENQKFATWRYKRVIERNKRKEHRKQRKIYHFYKCPSCSQKVRVPKGKGKICITCPKCKTEFIKKS